MLCEFVRWSNQVNNKLVNIRNIDLGGRGGDYMLGQGSEGWWRNPKSSLSNMGVVVVQGEGVCWYLKFANNSTIRYLFDDQTYFEIISLIKISDIQLRFSCDHVR